MIITNKKESDTMAIKYRRDAKKYWQVKVSATFKTIDHTAENARQKVSDRICRKLLNQPLEKLFSFQVRELDEEWRLKK